MHCSEAGDTEQRLLWGIGHFRGPLLGGAERIERRTDAGDGGDWVERAATGFQADDEGSNSLHPLQ